MLFLGFFWRWNLCKMEVGVIISNFNFNFKFIFEIVVVMLEFDIYEGWYKVGNDYGFLLWFIFFEK